MSNDKNDLQYMNEQLTRACEALARLKFEEITDLDLARMCEATDELLASFELLPLNILPDEMPVELSHLPEPQYDLSDRAMNVYKALLNSRVPVSMNTTEKRGGGVKCTALIIRTWCPACMTQDLFDRQRVRRHTARINPKTLNLSCTQNGCDLKGKGIKIEKWLPKYFQKAAAWLEKKERFDRHESAKKTGKTHPDEIKRTKYVVDEDN